METEGSRRAMTPYRYWMQAEGIPVLTGHGVTDVRHVDRQPWSRTGGKGAFLDLFGMEGLTGMYVGEIPPGQSLHPQKHLYEQMLFIVEGRGAAEVWLPGDEGRPASFEWGKGSLFSTPLNSWYRLHNGSNAPVIYLGVTNAPVFIDLLHNEDFVFNNDYQFTDRFNPDPDYFSREKRYQHSVSMFWETNFIADVGAAFLDAQERKGTGVRITHYQMAENALMGHMAEWPVGRYHKAHHHGGGAIITILRSKGYSLMWPLEAGTRPWENGREDAVVRVDWEPGAVFSPPSKWYHTHLNTGSETARQLAFRYGYGKYTAGFTTSATVPMINGVPAVYASYRDGGNLIEYEDEDPQILQDYESDLRRNGVTLQMPPRVYRHD